MFTLRFARWVGSDGRVIAIEPEAANFASLQRRISAALPAGRVIAIQAVAAETGGLVHLEVNKDHPGDHKIALSGIPVTAVTLDATVAEHGDAHVSLIKIDVQGAEMRVLQGAAKVLERCRPALFIEIDDAALHNQNSSADELVNFLTARGYQAHKLRRFRSPEPISSRALGQNGYEDILFLNSGIKGI